MPNYKIEYKINGLTTMFEFYLFVNPLGRVCYKCTKDLLKSINYISCHKEVHILPFHNQFIVDGFLDQINLPSADLKTRNLIFYKIYQAALAYKAASIQGKNKGRQFLLAMQKAVKGKVERFNHELAESIAYDVGLDVTTFIDDVKSDFVRELFLKDQRIAREMSVKKTPSLVIFEHQFGEAGILIENDISTHTIIKELDRMALQYFYNHEPNKQCHNITQLK